MRKTGVRVLLAAGALVLLAVGGCSSDDGGTDGVASANGDSSNRAEESTAPLSEEELHEQLLKYAQCLRDHGLDVEDPAPGEGIQVQVQGDPSQADAAMKACEDLSPPPPSDADESEEREDMLDFAQCMRDNGVEKFADPKPGEGTNIGPGVAEDPDFEAAEEACNDKIFGGAPDTQDSGSGT